MRVVSTPRMSKRAMVDSRQQARRLGRPDAPPAGDQDELPADVPGLTDAVGLRRTLERERLYLDHELVLGQQLGGQGKASAG